MKGVDMDSKWSINITKTDNRITIQYSSDHLGGSETILSNKQSIDKHEFLMNRLETILGFLYIEENLIADDAHNVVVTA